MYNGITFCIAEINTIWNINYTLKKKKRRLRLPVQRWYKLFGLHENRITLELLVFVRYGW